MSLNQTVRSETHLFSIKQLHLDCHYIGCQHSFLKEAPKALEAVEGEKNIERNVVPVFNRDRQYFTPSFVLSIDQHYYSQNKEFEKQKFFDKIQLSQAEMSNSSMNIVSPNFNFCQICKLSYDDYLTHINEKIHKKWMNQTTGNKYIKQICKGMLVKQKIIKKEDRCRKQKRNSQKLARVIMKQEYNKDVVVALSHNQSKNHMTNTQTNSI